ncbi:actin-like protein ARP6 [Armillaria novae-zelandiae]|uniref:Actin-like protein ARP6 n=1 Tax=Armillaria novae-zelandiae TaxID=153914 RepID=A0AA39PRB4_9AGAR|nr:actin-like protein ARP6 [Armillaria novae-zelandiae]
MTPTVILDNGACTVKAGVGDSAAVLVPNAIARSKTSTYFGHELLGCTDHASLTYRRPHDKGFIVDWDAQKAIWDGVFSGEVLGIDTTETSLLLTEPYHNLPNIQAVYDQFVFEEYQFPSYYRCTPAALLAAPAAECALIVDSGFSFTHVVPLLRGAPCLPAVKRLDIGGKLLTNHLKELLSFRQWNMMDQTHITNHVKELCCFVSPDLARDLDACRAVPSPLAREYALAEQRLRRPGDPGQVLVMNNERFSVPEIIFRPDDIGLNQLGLAGTVAASIALLPQDLQPMFWANITLIGGNTNLPGFRDRLLADLRPLAPVEWDISVHQTPDPITAAYDAARRLVASPAYTDRVVTRAEYLESGSTATRRKWARCEDEGREQRTRSRAGTTRKR